MSGDVSASGSDRVAELERELQLARREVKWVRIEQEHLTESLQRVRRQRSRLRDQVDTWSTMLAEQLSVDYWSASGGLLGRRRRTTGGEADLVREVEEHPLFDGAWYLRTHPAVARERISPALHYVRHGNADRLDPGPRFSTDGYLVEHPEAVGEDLPALLHAERNGHAAARSHGGEAATGDVHL